MLLTLQNLNVIRFMNNQLIPFNLRNIIIIRIYSSTEYQTEKQDNDMKIRHSSAQNKTTILGRGEVGVIDKFSKWRSVKFILILCW